MKVYTVFDRRKERFSKGDGMLEFCVVEDDKRNYHTTGIRITPDKWLPDIRQTTDREINEELFGKLFELKRAARLPVPENGTSFNKFYLSTLSKTAIYRDNTIKDHMATLNKLNQWNENITWDMLTPSLLQSFIDYLSKNYKPNTVWKHKKNLSRYIKLAYQQGLITSRPDMRLENVKYRDSKVRIYHTIEELERIENPIAFSNDITEYIRWAYLVSCYTGLRKSDVLGLTPNNVDKTNRRLLVYTRKNTQPVIIPVKEKVLDYIAMMLDFTDSKLDKQRVKTVNVNHVIKSIGEDAFIDFPVERMDEQGNVTSVPKWKLMTFHTGRRTALTQMYLHGIDPLSIMKISGHRTVEALMLYLNMTNEEVASKLKDNPWFQ